ncbi:MAG: Gldg family protein [Candidatus Brocadiia bacterium]
MSKTIRNALAVLCVLVIALCLILVLQKTVRGVSVDLTQEKIYTLSPGTRHILGQLSQPMTLKLYYSRTAAMKGPDAIRFFNSYYLYVRDLLEEYVKLSGGKLKLEVLDPRQYTDAEEEALQAGVKRFALSEEDVFFFGLVAQTAFGKVKVIPFFEPDRQDFVEYDISKLISTAVLRDKKKVGVLSSLELAGPEMSPYLMQMMRMQGREMPKPWTIITDLRETYDIETVPADADAIPAGLDFLMVVHPKDLPKKTLFAIDQFVMKGGRLMVFVDPFCVADQPRQQEPSQAAEPKRSSDLNALLRGWGVEMEPDEIAADRLLAIKAQLGPNEPPSPLLPYMLLQDDCFNRKEIITAPLHDVRVLFAGVLEEVPTAGVKVTPLLTTTSTGNVWKPAGPWELTAPNPEAIRRAVSDGTKPLMLACRLTGKFRTNFPNGLPAEEKKEPAPANGKPAEEPKPKTIEAVKEAPGEGVILVFADVDMISDMVAYREEFFGAEQQGDNAPLVSNALDFLAGSSDLIAIRSRGGFNRPFTVVDRIDREAEAATGDQVNALNERIKAYQDQLAKLGASATAGNEKLIAGEAVAQRKKVEEDIREAQKELRRLNAGKRARIEALGAKIETNDLVWAPAAVLLIAIVLAVVRFVRARRYIARRAS